MPQKNALPPLNYKRDDILKNNLAETNPFYPGNNGKFFSTSSTRYKKDYELDFLRDATDIDTEAFILAEGELQN